MRINTDFTGVAPGYLGDPEVQDTNLAKIEEYLNQCLAYLEQFMTDLSGDGQGVVSGGALTDGGALVVSAEAISSAWVGGTRITALAASINVPDDATSYIYLNSLGEYETDSTFAYSSTKIPRGKVVTAGGDITSLTEYDNRIFTMNEMMLHRIMPMGLLVTNDGVNTIVNVNYLDPAETGLESITIEGSDDGGATWTELAVVSV